MSGPMTQEQLEIQRLQDEVQALTGIVQRTLETLALHQAAFESMNAVFRDIKRTMNDGK